MNAPSTTSDVETPSRASTGPRLRRLTLSGWTRLLSRSEPRTQRGVVSGGVGSRLLRRAPYAARTLRLERAARAALIWGLLCYAMLHLVPLVLMVRSMDFPWHSDGPAIEARKWPRLRQLVAEDPDRPLLLMLGSSRTCWAFRAGDLDGMADSDGRPLRVYNFGIPATGAISQLLALRDLLAEGIRPRFLLLEFNPTLLGEYRRAVLNEEELLGVESISVRRLLKWLPYFRRPKKRIGLWLGARLAPWYTFRGPIQLEVKCLAECRLCPTYEPIDNWGCHIPRPIAWTDDKRLRHLTLMHAVYYPVVSQFRLGKKQTKVLHELLDMCRREKVPAAFVVMPESSQFHSWYCDAAKTQPRQLLDELSRTYGVAVIDANRWLADDDFEDGQHPLRHGAEVFTSRLRAELPRLLAQSKARKSD